MNIIIGINDLHTKLQICASKTEMCSNFYEICHLEQIEHVHYEYSTWNWWSWPKTIDSGKFGPSTEICSNFYEIWHSQKIEKACYKYNTSQCIERLHDYKFRMIIGSEHEKLKINKKYINYIGGFIGIYLLWNVFCEITN